MRGPRGADVIPTGNNRDRLEGAATEVGALSTATFDANDLAALAGGPNYALLAEMNFDGARRAA